MHPHQDIINAHASLSLSPIMEYHPHLQSNPPQARAATEPAGERYPQWSPDETRELLAIRAHLDRRFAATKRNKPLWEAVSSMLLLKGFHRSPEQCKSKWKNLVTRFKGSTEQAAEGRQFPFYEEMRRILSDRTTADKGKEVVHEELDEESGKKRTKAEKNKTLGPAEEVAEVEGLLREFMRRQRELEARWVEAAEAREAERRAKEAEWRMMMMELRKDRVDMERRWRESEEERWAREEARAERRHHLIVAILEQLAKDS